MSRSRSTWSTAFQIFDYYYERKPRQFDGKTIDIRRLFTTEYVAQAFLAVVLRTPSDSRARKYKVWGESHGKICAGGSIEPYIVSTIIASRVAEWLRGTGYMSAQDEIERLAAKRGSAGCFTSTGEIRRRAYQLRGWRPPETKTSGAASHA